MHAAPQVFLQPVGNGWSKHAENGNPHPLSFHYGVRFQIRFAGIVVYYIGSEYGAIDFFDPFVIDLVSGFDIMIADGLCVILHVVYGMYGSIRYFRVGVVAVEAGGLSLQYVSVVEQHNVAFVFLPYFLHVVAHPCH